MYCMVTLTKMDIVFTQSKSYAVLTKSTLPTEALLRVETVTGRIVWRKSNCVNHLDPIVEDKKRVQDVEILANCMGQGVCRAPGNAS